MADLRRKLKQQPVTSGGFLRCSLTRADAAEHLLATVAFGRELADPAAPGRMHVNVALTPLLGQQPVERWLSSGPVQIQRQGLVCSSADGNHFMGVIAVDEAAHGGICEASEAAYRQIIQLQAGSAYPHMLRTWNYFGAINAGDDDEERYKQFCAGRAAALADARTERLPAASAIGTHAADGVLQVYWIASRLPGRALENPRQLSAYSYPRRYGPAAPTFSRAMLSADGTLFISGTASIVGHASRHAGQLSSQVDETLENVDTLIAQAHQLDARVPARLGSHSIVKIYVRHVADAAAVLTRLQARYGTTVPTIVLQGDICRRELLLEMECVHGGMPGT
jgi:chorismate lyase / 3-hydroxybenzoate synthase